MGLKSIVKISLVIYVYLNKFPKIVHERCDERSQVRIQLKSNKTIHRDSIQKTSLII